MKRKAVSTQASTPFLLLQKTLIKFGWNELLIAAFSFRSTQLTEDGIKLSDGMIITREEAHTYGVGEIFERVIQELIAKMREVDMVRHAMHGLLTVSVTDCISYTGYRGAGVLACNSAV